jgi:hypothetical protein
MATSPFESASRHANARRLNPPTSRAANAGPAMKTVARALAAETPIVPTAKRRTAPAAAQVV